MDGENLGGLGAADFRFGFLVSLDAFLDHEGASDEEEDGGEFDTVVNDGIDGDDEEGTSTEDESDCEDELYEAGKHNHWCLSCGIPFRFLMLLLYSHGSHNASPWVHCFLRGEGREILERGFCLGQVPSRDSS